MMRAVDSLQHFRWTKAGEVADQLVTVLPTLAGDPFDAATLQGRAWALLADLADADHEPAFRARLEASLAQGIEDHVALATLERVGASMDRDQAARCLEVVGIASRGALSLAAMVAPAHTRAVFEVAVREAGSEVARSLVVRCAARGARLATLGALAYERWWRDADIDDPEDQRAFASTLSNPRSVRALMTLPPARWPRVLLDRLQDGEPSSRAIARTHAAAWAEVVARCALPPRVLVAEVGGVDALCRALEARLERWVEHRAAVDEAREKAVAAAALDGVVKARIKGGFRVELGPLVGFLGASQLESKRASQYPSLSPGDRVLVRVVRASRRSIILELADQAQTGPVVLAPVGALLPVEYALRLLVRWRPAARLLERHLRGALHETVFRVLAKHAPQRAAAWVVGAGRAGHADLATLGWRAWALRFAVVRDPVEWARALHPDADPDRRRAALRALGPEPLPDVVVAALRVIAGPTHDGLRALAALARNGDAAAAAELRDVLVDETAKASHRGRALGLLGSYDPSLVRDLALQFVRRRDRLAVEAARVLYRSGDDEAMTELLRTALDPSSVACGHLLAGIE